jgi:glycine cleavage system H lipoate-binding protein
MTVLLVLSTFVIFLVIDHFYSKRALRPVVEPILAAEMPRRPQPNIVSGFLLPETLRYHPGHSWAQSEGPKLVRTGLDDFAARVIGKVEKITLPQRGQWVRQGQKICTVHRKSAAADIVAPVEGVVAEINEAALADPELARKDPYGEGWLVAIESPDAKLNFRNLLSGDLARWWMEEAGARLRKHLPMTAGAMADGGVAVYDLGGEMSDEQWTKVAKEFFLG